MERRRLGRSGAFVGVVGLGTSTWGCGTDRAEATEQVRLLLDEGGDLVDLGWEAVRTGFPGEILRDTRVRSDAFLSLRMPAVPSQRELLATLDAALGALGVDHVDLWSVEGWHDDLPWEELVAALTVAVASGRVHYLGSVPDAPWEAALVGSALEMHPQHCALTSISARYSLLDHAIAAEAASVAQALGATLLAAWPLAGGVLTGKYRHATPPDSRGAGERHALRLQDYRSPWSRPVVDGLCAAAEGLDASPAAIALAWVRDRPGVTATIVGARTVHQWRAALLSEATVLPPAIRSALDEVSSQAGRIRDDGDDGVRSSRESSAGR